MKGLQSFYNSFYGPNFFRHFRAPTDLKNKKIRNPGNQVTVKKPKNLALQVHNRSGLWKCLTHVYNHGTLGNLKREEPEKMVYDRAFFDFDVNNDEVHEIVNKLKDIRADGLNHHQEKQDELREQLRNLIINEKIAEPAINQAKDFSNKLKKWFDAYPILFFSGCKGCHAYSFFKPVRNVDINRVVSWFAEEMKETYQHSTMDLSVCKDAKSRLSRAPYSKHDYSLLTVVPFQLEDSYDTIMEKSLNPVVEPFTWEDYNSGFGKYLQRNDKILAYNEKIEEDERKATRANLKPTSKRVKDHREWFKSILGEPAYTSPNKPYVMYHCPFPKHEDSTPSFMVYPTGYNCKGCGRKGNYFQFLKDYHGWSNEQVKNYLKKY